MGFLSAQAWGDLRKQGYHEKIETVADQLLAVISHLGNTLEEQSRAVLGLVLVPGEEQLEVIEPDPGNCPNCGAPAQSVRSPYCGPRCREIAGFVRQMRAGLDDGEILDPDRQVALGQTLWYLLGGGRPLRIDLVPQKAVQLVSAKAGGNCALCGKPATTLDHIATACNRPINLRAVCADCTTFSTFGDCSFLARPAAQGLRAELTARIGLPLAQRACDDASTWDWREFLKKREAPR